MKKITTFLGCVGVVCLFWGCSSSEDILDPNAAFAEDEEIASSESGDTPTSSSSSTNNPSSSTTDKNSQKEPGTGTIDSVIVNHDTVTKKVVIIQDADLGNIPTPNYRKDEVFCWTDECKTKYAGQTTNPDLQSSSSMTIDISMSQEAQIPPTKNGNTLTDNRDGKTYKLETVSGTVWMAENINYESSTGYYCKDGEGNNMCAKYGGFYTYGVAQRICPAGWRLPTQAEVEAAKDAVDFEWWTIGGRFEVNGENDTVYGQAEEQGRYWLTNTSSNSVRIENYSSKEFNFESPDGSTRAYNVRCVEGTLE